jgi:hypothetical protein
VPLNAKCRDGELENHYKQVATTHMLTYLDTIEKLNLSMHPDEKLLIDYQAFPPNKYKSLPNLNFNELQLSAICKGLIKFSSFSVKGRLFAGNVFVKMRNAFGKKNYSVLTIKEGKGRNHNRF